MILNKLIKKIIFFLGLVFIYLNSSSTFAANSDYAALPPFISADVKPNVLFVMDYSGSMQAPANYSTASHSYTGGVINYGDFKDDIYVNYNKDKKYFGYFDPEKYYKYNSSDSWKNDKNNTLSGYWEVDNSISFEDRRMGDLEGSLSGNFLNCLLMTRVDVTFKSLFGGLADCPNDKKYCVLKSRGSKRDVYLSSDKKIRVSIRPQNYGKSGAYFTDVKIKVEKGALVFDRYGRVKVDKKERKGIIQENFDKVRFGFMAYADSSNDTAKEGKIKYGLHHDDMDDLIKQFQDTLVYSGTHTGEALTEAYNYLAQNDKMKSYNSSYEDKGTEKDPYYEKNSNGNLEAAWCRKSYVVLISDGEYNDGFIDPYRPAHNLHLNDLRTKADFPGKQNAEVYSLFAFSDDEKGQNSMKTVAAFGKYEDLDGCSSDKPYDFDKVTDSRTFEFPTDNCNPDGKYNNCCKEWDKDGDGVPDNYFEASDGEAMASALTAIFSEIRQGTSSGTAITDLTSKSTGGAVVSQAAFYPEKEFDNDKKITWTGDLIGNWYLNDEFKDADGQYQKIQNIREDTNQNFILNVKEDRILEYLIENDALKIKASEPDEYGDVKVNGLVENYGSFQEINNLFDSGKKLMETKPEKRKIYGVGKNNSLTEFTKANSGLFDSVLGTNKTEYPPCLIDGSDGTPDYEKLINYTRGKDYSGCRLRAVNNSTTDENVWKLGDITYSSPTIVNYGTHAIVYIGSNSGMLHAFRMGFVKNRLEILNPTELLNNNLPASGTDKIGVEEWAFIPKDAMPYLRYMASPDYDHIYTVDLKPFVVNTAGKRILIGGMRLGGGNKNGNINPPSDTAPTGRSAYFALDITDSANPKYLWRYAPDGLGFSYSGPAYIKRKNSSGETKHFVMFASGPTDYNGSSVQSLKVFVIDLLTGEEKAIESKLNIKNAFGGRLFTNGLDVNNDGQTDFVFLGYTDKADKDFKEMGGGVIKIYTGSDDPKKWDYNSSFLTSDNNPITAPIAFEKCFPKSIPFPYLYFGTGRYFISDDDTQKNKSDLNYLYGVPFTCDENNENCSTINNIGNASELTCERLKKVKTNPGQASWKIELNPNQDSFLRERCYSDPSPTTENIVFFSTNRPSSVICKSGGESRSWALNCATGRGLLYDICPNESIYEVDKDIKFEYLLQLSRGDIKQYGKGAFNGDVGSSPFGPGLSSESGGMTVFSKKSNLGLTPTIHYWKEW